MSFSPWRPIVKLHSSRGMYSFMVRFWNFTSSRNMMPLQMI
jgi:hypothetical protein